MEIRIESYAAIGVADLAAGTTAQAWLPDGYTLTGGGAFDLGAGAGNVLASSYPVRNQDGEYRGWAAAGRDAFPLAVYAVGIRVLRGGLPVEVDQQVFCATSAQVARPGVSARLGRGWIGTGGGALDNCAGPGGGSVLTSSYPLISAEGKICGWGAAGKDPAMSDQARVSAFVIGIRGTDGIELSARLVSNSSFTTGFPSALVRAPGGNAVMAGGGALGGQPGQCMLLSASCPVISSCDGRLTGWFASRKVDAEDVPGPITAYGVIVEAA